MALYGGPSYWRYTVGPLTGVTRWALLLALHVGPSYWCYKVETLLGMALWMYNWVRLGRFFVYIVHVYLCFNAIYLLGFFYLQYIIYW